MAQKKKSTPKMTHKSHWSKMKLLLAVVLVLLAVLFFDLVEGVVGKSVVKQSPEEQLEEEVMNLENDLNTDRAADFDQTKLTEKEMGL